MLEELTPDAVARLLADLPNMPAAEKLALLDELELLEDKKKLQACRDDFLKFCAYMYTDWKEGPHHRYMKGPLHNVKDGAELRLTVSMPPRFGKSETIAYLFIAWYLGHHPHHHIMMATHTSTLSSDFGRKVRNLIDTDKYRKIFPATIVSKDKSASDNWATTSGGKYLAIGIGANVAGHGAHLLIADDLVSEQAVLANPDAAFDTAWTYMQVGPMQRLMPGGRIVMIGCMTAETSVLMADGSEKEIQHIQVGDSVVTYDAGTVTTSRITNWIAHPSDFVYKIRTSSGIIVRANKKHPFLVDRNGARSWVRVRDLKVGDCLVKVVQPQGVGDHIKPEDCAVFATNASCASKDVPEPSAEQETGENGRALSAQPRSAESLCLQKGCVKVVMARKYGVTERTALLLSKSAKATSSTGMAFLQKFLTLCSKVKAAVVQSASALRPKRMQGLDKRQNYTLITATPPIRSEGSCVTTATWQSGMQEQKAYCSKQQATYATIPDVIVEIVEDGFEPVFDMEVERTENFIANGVVSHNTRWGKKDPIGRALAWAEQNPAALPWHEIRFPAILPSGKSLWPAQWPVDQLLAKRAGMQPQYWSAQYMQEPTSEEGALLKRDWWKIWEKEDPPDVEFVMQVWDTAHETKNNNDYSACTTWGVWYNEETNRHELMLLNAIKARWEFPQLKEKVLEHYAEWEPECLLVEKKAAGAPLIQELRQMDIIVEEYSPSRGASGVSNDKRARVSAISPMFFDGIVWAPDFRWAYEVINECAEFPNGENDDYVDTVAMACARYRRGGFISLKSDRRDERPEYGPRRAAYY